MRHHPVQKDQVRQAFGNPLHRLFAVAGRDHDKAFGLQIHYHNRKPVHSKIEEQLEATYWESLDQMLAREGREAVARACFDFIPTRAALDLSGWTEEDVFAH